MDVSDLRRRILHALDDARRASAGQRQARDDVTRAWERFLETVAVPLLRQAADVLRAEGHIFVLETPAGRVRLASERAAETFLEFTLDASARIPQVLGRTSRARRRGDVEVEERPLGAPAAIAALTEEDVARFLVAEIPKLVVR